MIIYCLNHNPGPFLISSSECHVSPLHISPLPWGLPEPITDYYEKVKWSESHSVVSNSLQPHGLYSPWNSPGQDIGVGSFSLLQGIFPTQESNRSLMHCRRILYQLNYQGTWKKKKRPGGKAKSFQALPLWATWRQFSFLPNEEIVIKFVVLQERSVLLESFENIKSQDTTECATFKLFIGYIFWISLYKEFLWV